MNFADAFAVNLFDISGKVVNITKTYKTITLGSSSFFVFYYQGIVNYFFSLIRKENFQF